MSETKVINAVVKMEFGKSAGLDDVSVEMIK